MSEVNSCKVNRDENEWYRAELDVLGQETKVIEYWSTSIDTILALLPESKWDIFGGNYKTIPKFYWETQRCNNKDCRNIY